jgi:riboflavin kinase/FMN adenylyltransferase
MQLLHPKQEIKSPTVVTIGTFDGVHLGHRKIFEKVQKIARKKDLKSILVTFEPPPKRFFSNGKIENLTILSEKVEILADIGLDYFLVLPFNKELVRTSYKDFVKKTLKNSLQAKYLVVGYDFRMGHGKEGNPENLMEMGFFVTIIAPFKIEGEPVKSSFIRELVKEGKIERANKFLGYPYRLSGCL